MDCAMTALTDRERQEIRRRLYDEKVNDFPFILEALGEASQQQADAIKTALKTGDAVRLMMQCNILIKGYIDSELLEDAENEVLASKEVNGKRWMEA